MSTKNTSNDVSVDVSSRLPNDVILEIALYLPADDIEKLLKLKTFSADELNLFWKKMFERDFSKFNIKSGNWGKLYGAFRRYSRWFPDDKFNIEKAFKIFVNYRLDVDMIESLFTNPELDLNSSLEYASMRGDVRIVEKLLENPKVDPNFNNNNAFLEAAAKGKIDVIKSFLKNKKFLSNVNLESLLYRTKRMQSMVIKKTPIMYGIRQLIQNEIDHQKL